jgi:hypothetical protein
MDITQILSSKFAGSEWTLSGDDYTGLTWLSDTPKPTKKALEALWSEVQYETAYARVEQARQAEYQATTDPLFFEFQRGDVTEQAWLDAVQAVKDANPYPESV